MQRRRVRALHVSLADGSHSLHAVDNPDIIGPIDFAWSLGDAGRLHTTLGAGPLAGSFVPGSSRLVVCGHSPIWDGFHASTIGGAGGPWDTIGANYLVLSDRAPQPSVLVLVNGSISVQPLDPEPHWREEGLYALMRHAHARWARDLDAARVLAVGPAAARTRAGAIGSAPILAGVVSSIDTWAGRGGLGSRLYQHHNLVAIVYGGDSSATEQPDAVLLDRMSVERFGKPLKLVELEATTKYRFDPAFKTGGTFGSNYHTLRERAISFNYRSVLLDDDARGRIHDRLIAGHYLRQFDDEIAKPKKGCSCGEPCGVACKKVDGKFKKDYEPYQALGPLIGVFDQRAAEGIARYADACGFDAIQIGGDLAWIMEGLARGAIPPADVGLTEGPRWDADSLDPVADSAHNAALGRRLIDFILYDPRGATYRRGLRAAASALGGEHAQAAVYNANGGGDGCMVPNQYWVAGMFAPVPIMGRYYLDYTYEWKPPFELGRACAERMTRELMLDNYGMCRFHRGWAETLLPELVNKTLGIRVDADVHHRGLAAGLNVANRAQPWQTERVVDMVRTYLEKYRADGPPEPELGAWIDRFAADRAGAARAYWQEIREGLDTGLR